MPDKKKTEPAVDVNEAARITGLSDTTLHRLFERGEIEGYVIYRGLRPKRMFYTKSVHKFMREHPTAPPEK